MNEKNAPFIFIGYAVVVLIGLMLLLARNMLKRRDGETSTTRILYRAFLVTWVVAIAVPICSIYLLISDS